MNHISRSAFFLSWFLFVGHTFAFPIQTDSTKREKPHLVLGAGLFISTTTIALNFSPSIGVNYKRNSFGIDILYGPKIRTVVNPAAFPTPAYIDELIDPNASTQINGGNLFYEHNTIFTKRSLKNFLGIYWGADFQFLYDKYIVPGNLGSVYSVKHVFGLTPDFGLLFHFGEHLELKSGIGLGPVYYSLKSSANSVFPETHYSSWNVVGIFQTFLSYTFGRNVMNHK
jgi:hypothetical protein